MGNPKTNSVRSLAGRYHLSMKHVDAILRLKGLEESWVEVCPVSYVIFLARSWRNDVYTD